MAETSQPAMERERDALRAAPEASAGDLQDAQHFMAILTAVPKVTVITPAYNRADYLEEVIQSVLDQDYADVEYIVLDDGSTDGTPALLDRYRDRVRVERHENMGETSTVNRGFELATGEIVGIVNSDDPLLPGAVRRAVETLDANPEVVVVYPDWDMIDAAGQPIQTICTFDYRYIDMLRWHHCVPGPGTFFRKNLADRLGGRDPQFRYIADFDFWLRAGLVGPFKRIPEVLATFRHHVGGASTSAQGARMAAEHIRLVDKIFMLPLPAEARRVRREAYSSANWVAGVVSGGAPSYLRKKYFAKAFVYKPSKYLTEYRDRLAVILREFKAGWRGHAKAILRAVSRRIRRLPTGLAP